MIGADFENSSVPDGVWLTLSEPLHEGRMLIGATGDGVYYSINLSNRTAQLRWSGRVLKRLK